MLVLAQTHSSFEQLVSGESSLIWIQKIVLDTRMVYPNLVQDSSGELASSTWQVIVTQCEFLIITKLSIYNVMMSFELKLGQIDIWSRATNLDCRKLNKQLLISNTT